MNTMRRIEKWAAGLSPAATTPWLALYAAICVLWAIEFDPSRTSVALAFAPIWAGWHR